ncbi:hypothetical protein SPRG_06279 [Saprolegnia parasitica CBS 223.65]|uniref:Uncharacterized protein n=1 Tax=Saprolegnia parasitica (strain CBS 223.65) TaxID=695850 RepID=A0A067CGF7_SAPPC|nr:hypothetical protein SPRG_06279 [Saprolegnia parasitica CBS 223.65]KDO28230.1 hypothetical protein SPRG_06279 [Saprolegnia parasitica CBS 223.65]|eukprot:XP_012201055.1 hypothetical protein SPRG_06279 [Saprolegnia parasitica CBS 223.65]
MGCTSSTVKRELAALKEAEKAHADELLKLQDERRMLQYKVTVLEEMVATAHIEAHEKSQVAAKCEERMKAMKWEMVRQSLPHSPRQPVSWELKEGSVRSPTNQETPDTPDPVGLETKPSLIPKPETKAESKIDATATFKKAVSRTSTLEKIKKPTTNEPLTQRETKKPSLSRGSSASDMSLDGPASGIPKPNSIAKRSDDEGKALPKGELRKPSSNKSIASLKSMSSIGKGSMCESKAPRSEKEPESEDDDFIKEIHDNDDVVSVGSSTRSHRK